MDPINRFLSRISYPFLRITMGLVLVWIGAMKFADPASVVGLLSMTPFSLFASLGFVYALGVFEVIVGLLFWANIQVKYVAILNMGLFVATIAIFILTPAVAYGEGGFPLLSLPGEFLLKDTVLMAASAALSAMAGQREMGQMAMMDRQQMRAA